MRRHAVLVVALLVALAARAQAGEDAMRAAVDAYRAFEFSTALQLIESIERDPSATPELRVRALLYRGLIHAQQSQWQRADAAFEEALALDVDAELPEMTSPKVVARFTQIRTRLREQRQQNAPPPPEASSRLTEKPPPTTSSSADPTGAPPPSPPAMSSAPWILAGLGTTAIVAGGALGALAKSNKNDFDETRFASDAVAARDRTQRLATSANIAYGVGTTALLSAGIWWLCCSEP